MRSEKTVLSTLSASAPAEMSVRFGMIVYYLEKTISCGCVNKKNLIQPLDLKGKTNKYGCTAIKQLEKHSDSYTFAAKNPDACVVDESRINKVKRIFFFTAPKKEGFFFV